MTQTFPWIVNAAEAKQLIADGATILDVRNPIRYGLRHVKGAVRVSWRQFSRSHMPDCGKLLTDRAKLTEKFQAVGIDPDRPVIVVSQPPKTWGEEGRIVWTLRSLGHSQAAFVNGGQAALEQAGVPLTWGWTRAQRGNFEPEPTPQWSISQTELKDAIAQDSIRLLDTREPREYAGATPYGEQRGGHLPGALPLYYKDLFKDEYLQPADHIRAKLHHYGIDVDTPVATYCTGGVRSAFVVAVLTQLGFQHAKNYAGSTWEWAAADRDEYPLITSDADIM